MRRMIRIIKTKALAVLCAEAALVPGLRVAAEHASKERHEAEAALLQAKAAQASAEAERDATRGGVAAALARLEVAASDPETGSTFRGGIALHILRSMVADIMASGSPAAIDRIRIVDIMIGREPAPPVDSLESSR